MGTFGSLIIVLIIMGILLYTLVSFVINTINPVKNSSNGGLICPHCGTRENAKTITKGSLGIEVILWLCFIIPGLIYSIWRHASRFDGCTSCGQAGLISVTSPAGSLLVEKYHPTANTNEAKPDNDITIEKLGIKFNGQQYIFSDYKYDRLEDAIAYAKKTIKG